MYKHDQRQMAFYDEPLLFGGLPLNKENRWIRLAAQIPWARVEDEYRKQFTKRVGQAAKSVSKEDVVLGQDNGQVKRTIKQQWDTPDMRS